MNRKTVFITGASGLIGSHVAERLSRQGYRVVCGVRNSSRTDFLKTIPVELRLVDLTNMESLIAALKDADAVIHTAGKVCDWGRWDDFYNTNVVGTINVLKACAANHIKQVITTGSVSCFGEEHCLTPKNEQSPYLPKYNYFMGDVWPSGMNHYRVSKAMAVTESKAFAAQHGLDVTVIHPAWVYGEREFSSGFYEYMKFVKSGMPCGPGSSSSLFHVVYARDVALAYQLALEKALPGFNEYIIGNKTACRFNDVLQLICSEMARRKPWYLPKSVAYPIGLVAELAATLFHAQLPPFLTRARVNMFYDSICYSTQKAEDELSFTCQYSLDEGIKRTVKWYNDNHLI